MIMWLVIGYGSTLHSDDGFGAVVAEHVRALTATGAGGRTDSDASPVHRPESSPTGNLGIHAGTGLHRAGNPGLQYEVITTLQLTPELAEPISRASGVIFIDAAMHRTPGELICLYLPPASSRTPNERPAYTHHVTPYLLLDTALALYGHAPPGWLYTAGGINFELGETLSSIVAQTVPRAVDLIMERLHGPRPPD
jgi:Ni,Fe-hydrogenase maturation factor